MSQTFIKGTIVITLATLISKILGSLFRIPLQNIAGDEVNGIFQIVYPVYMIVLTLSVAGIPIAISKLISESRAENNERKIRDIFVTSSIITVIFGCFSFSLMFGFSKQLSFALGGEFVQLSIMVVATTLIFAPYMAVYRGFFQGFENMTPTAMSQVLEQFIRFIVTLGIAYVLVHQGASNEAVAGWIMLGSISGVIVSLIYLRLKFIRSQNKPKVSERYRFNDFRKWSKTILSLSIPIAVGAIMMALFNMIDSLTIPNALNQKGLEALEIQNAYGIYGRGQSLVQIVVVFSSAVILPLIPLISKTMVTNGVEATNTYIEQALKFAHFISLPLTFGLVGLSLPVNLTLFEDYQGTAVIAVLGLSSLFTSYTVLTTGILQGLNRSKQVAVVLICLTVVKAILNIVLVQQFGVIGGAWSTLMVYVVLTAIHLLWIQKVSKYSSHIKEFVKMVIASIVMMIATAGPLYYFNWGEWSRVNGLIYLVIIVPIGAMIYAGLIYITGVISKEEIQKFPLIGKVAKRLN